jgi:hypothetical protein
MAADRRAVGCRYILQQAVGISRLGIVCSLVTVYNRQLVIGQSLDMLVKVVFQFSIVVPVELDQNSAGSSGRSI